MKPGSQDSSVLGNIVIKCHFGNRRDGPAFKSAENLMGAWKPPASPTPGRTKASAHPFAYPHTNIYIHVVKNKINIFKCHV